jgi:hypothetical protein
VLLSGLSPSACDAFRSGYQQTLWISSYGLPNQGAEKLSLDRKGRAVRTRTSESVTTEDVLNALGRYTEESNESDRQTATKLGINRLMLKAWLRGADRPQRCLLARLAGFLRRVGYL